MSLKDDLRGYILAYTAGSDDPIDLSSEHVHEAFVSDYPDITIFHEPFANAVEWLQQEGLVRFNEIAPGTDGEYSALDLVATQKGEQAIHATVGRAVPRNDIHIEIARMVGAGLAEFLNTYGG